MRTIIFVGGPLHLRTREFVGEHFMSMGYLDEKEKYTSYTIFSPARGESDFEYWLCKEATEKEMREAMVKMGEI